MQKRIFSIMTTWPFLVSLFLLIINDCLLKSLYPSFITGKLSDFSGLAVVGMLIFSIFPQKKLFNYVAIALFFVWWKSPLSDAAIMIINQVVSPLKMGRVIDYTDIFALMVLPVSSFVVNNYKQFQIKSPQLKKMLQIPIFTITIFSIMATSSIPNRQSYLIRNGNPTNKIKQDEISQTITAIAVGEGLRNCVSKDDVDKYCYASEAVTMRYSFTQEDAIEFAVLVHPTLLRNNHEEKAVRLRSALKYQLGKKFQGLEYVEKLPWDKNQ
jgi:hypothetical protein